jgi:hypothetical protein
MEVKDKVIYDYSSLDKKVDKIIKISASYLTLPIPVIETQVKKAYIFAREAHE